MRNLEKELDEALKKVRVIDPHCHLGMQKPSADNLADILLYHHLWIELISSGMGQYEVTTSGLPQELEAAEMDPLERVKRALKYLPNIENTTVGLFLRWILKDLYAVETLSEKNLKEVWDKVAIKAKDPSWSDEVLWNRCGIAYSISVEPQGAPYSGRLLKGRQVYVMNLADGKKTASEVLLGWEKILGREIRKARDYQELLSKIAASIHADEYKFIGLSVLPGIRCESTSEKLITNIIGKIKKKKSLSEEETGAFCYFGACTFLDLLRKTPLRLVQLVVGAEVLLPHRSITHWHGNFPPALARIASTYEDFHFDISTASDTYTQDLGILAKHIPNLSLSGYWWHTLYPFYIKKAIETRLDMVPVNKIIAFFSDAYHAEWCYPKLKLVKQIVKQVLLERVEREWYTLDSALEVIQKIFYENPKRIYNIVE